MSLPPARAAAPALTRETLRRLQRQALRLCRRPDDADDLVQETLLAAVSAGRHDLPWLSGVLRRQAALAARTGIRRRRREGEVDPPSVDDDPAHAHASCDAARRRAWLATLPPSARRVAVLALHGLNADEIRWILRLPPTAFRQRLTRIRHGLSQLEPTLRDDLQAVREPRRTVDLPFGLTRRALKAAMQAGEGLGTHDEDGHLILIDGSAHTSLLRGNQGTGSLQEDTPC